MRWSDEGLPPPLTDVKVRRWQLGQPLHGPTASHADQVITEAPVALVFNGVSHVVMMATPTQLQAMALGFAISEGVIPDATHCLGMDVIAHPQGLEVRMEITTRHFEALKERRRQMAGYSACGLCGIDSLQALHTGFPAPDPQARPSIPASTVIVAAQQAMAQLTRHQHLNAASGACHAAGWANLQGDLLITHEDVGRHNALDKLIGDLAHRRALGEPGVVVMSSRASLELVRKCVRSGLGALATISAPTSMAVSEAQAHAIHLLGFCRDLGLVQYTP